MPTGIYKRTEEHNKIRGLSHLGKKYKPMSEIGKKNLSLSHIGHIHSIETKRKMSITQKKIGNKPPSPKGRIKSKETREKLSKANKGEKNHWWKGGLTSTNQNIKNSFEYKQWRKSVFERDYYTCLICSKIGGRLNAHHIKSFAKFPKLRFDINNGITLCFDCHKIQHKRY